MGTRTRSRGGLLAAAILATLIIVGTMAHAGIGPRTSKARPEPPTGHGEQVGYVLFEANWYKGGAYIRYNPWVRTDTGPFFPNYPRNPIQPDGWKSKPYPYYGGGAILFMDVASFHQVKLVTRDFMNCKLTITDKEGKVLFHDYREWVVRKHPDVPGPIGGPICSTEAWGR
jgi:hypothetical protein